MTTRKTKEFPCSEDLNIISAKAKAAEIARREKERTAAFENLLWATATNLKAAARMGEREMVTDISYYVGEPRIRDEFFKILESKGYKAECLSCTQYQIRITW
jgi:hypothetical protein